MIRYIAFYYDHRKEGTFEDFKLFFEKNLDVTKNILIIGPHIKKSHMKIIRRPEYLHKILVIFEPIKNFPKYYKFSYDLITNHHQITTNKIKLFGSVQHDLDANLTSFKFPLYLLQWSFDCDNKTQFEIVNSYVNNMDLETLEKKRFSCLITKWDPIGHRTKVHNLLSRLGKVECPSKLFNNCSNEELNKIGKKEYLKKYTFNICPENFDVNTHPGYITEKLMDACLGGAIPIYAGWSDEYDSKIFNKNRIIFYKSSDENSFNTMFDKIKELVENKNKLLEFYKQPVFCKTAFDTIQQLKLDFINNY